ncbi:MAG: TRAP transporter substrate-binding protein DctP [Thermodesulfobacteriota bacterium]
MKNAHYRSTGLYLFCFLILLSHFALTFNASAKELSPEDMQRTTEETMTAIMTGQEFGPGLTNEQQALRGLLERGVITSAQLESMVEKTMLPLLNRHKTSRYVLLEAGERVNTSFAPYINWERCREIAWKAGASIVPDGEEVLLKIGTLAPPGTPWLTIPDTVLFPRIARLSDNKFIVKIFGGGVMGEDTDILRKMDIGQLDGCGCTALGLLASGPDISVFLLPGLFSNYEEIDYIREKFRKRIDEAFEKRGYILGAFIDTGFFYIFSREKIKGLDDLKKQSFINWFGEMETALYDELGITSTPVSVPETISAISTGLANANMAPPAWMLGMQAYQYVNYYIKTPVLYSPGVIVISAQTKERIRKRFATTETFAFNVQEMLIYEVSTIENDWKKLSRNYEEKCLQAFEQRCGIKAVELSVEDQKTLKQASLNVHEKLAGKLYPRDLMDDITKALAQYRSQK